MSDGVAAESNASPTEIASYLPLHPEFSHEIGIIYTTLIAT